MDDKRIYTLSRETPSRAVIKMGVPLIAGMLIMVLYNLVDTYFIGLTHDDYQLGAVNLAYPIMMISVALANMVGTGASSLIARSLGAGDKNAASKTLTAAFSLTVINSLIVTAAGLLFLDPIVTALGAGEFTFGYTRQYVLIILSGSIFTMGNYILGQLLRSEGSVKYSIAGMLAGTAVNIIFDPLLIFTFGLGIRGAAYATVLGNAVATLLSLLFYISRKTLVRPSRRFIIPQAFIVGEILWVGIPASLETLLTSAAYIVNNNLAVRYGELTVAATGIAQKVLTLGNYIYQGFAAGTQPLMGYNYGSKDFRRMMAVLKAGVIVVTSTELAVMAGYIIFAPLIVGIFTDHAEVIATGTKALRAMAFILPFVGSVSMSRMSFQAMGKPFYAFGITVVRQLLLYIPMLLLFDHLWEFNGLICAQPVTEAIMMTVSVLLLRSVIRREERRYTDC